MAPTVSPSRLGLEPGIRVRGGDEEVVGKSAIELQRAPSKRAICATRAITSSLAPRSRGDLCRILKWRRIDSLVADWSRPMRFESAIDSEAGHPRQQ